MGPKLEITGQPLSLDVEQLGLSSTLRLDHAEFFSYDRAGRTPMLGHLPADAGWTGLDEPVERLLFSVPNFHPFVGRLTRSPGEGGPRYSMSRLVLEGCGWILTIDQDPAWYELDQDAKRRRGFAIGHTCELRRANGDLISRDDAADMVDAVFCFLSFCRGLWSGPILPCGESGGQVVWTRWSVPKLTPRRGVLSWFPTQRPTAVQSCFDGFMRAWASGPEGPARDLCWNAIHWYVEANTGAGGLEGSLILSQTAAELLGWICLVEEGDLSANEFDKRMGATERLRQLLEWAQVGVDVPASLEDVADLLRASDGPELIKKFRDGLVHPKPTRRNRLREIGFSERSTIAALSNYYVELGLLRRFEYVGAFSNRMNDGEVELTPWEAAR